jgi:hypothetical protein
VEEDVTCRSHKELIEYEVAKISFFNPLYEEDDLFLYWKVYMCESLDGLYVCADSSVDLERINKIFPTEMLLPEGTRMSLMEFIGFFNRHVKPFISF